jgi:ATP-dependent DNA ligase
MTLVLDVLDQIEAEPGKLEKRRIMKDNDSPELRKLLVYGTSPYINFGLGQLPNYPDAGFEDGQPLNTFFSLADKLKNRELTGNAMRSNVANYLAGCTEQQRKWFGRILTKNLRAGVDTAINDVWPGTIPEFNPALAEDYFKSVATPKKAEKNNKFPKLQSVKLDGMRAIAVHDSSWGLYSREGRPITGMDHILEQLTEYGDKDRVYDGELYSHEVVTVKGFPYLIGLLKRQSWDLNDYRGKDVNKVREQLPWKNKVEYQLFDSVSLEDWNNQQNSETQFNRLAFLKEHVQEINGLGAGHIQYVQHHVVKTLEEAVKNNGQFLSSGFEGSMLKDPSAPYKFGRGAQWMKYKLFEDREFTILGTYEGEGKWANSLGGFNMVTADGKPFDCGGGRISMEERTELWEVRESLIGKKATVRFFELSPDGIPRFPIFHAIREPGT